MVFDIRCISCYSSSIMLSNKLFVCISFLAFTTWSVLSQKCPENEHYDECGSNCPQTCENPTPRQCSTKCKVGCFCNSGLVRDTEINECVPIEECPGAEPGPCKDKNEEFRKCGPVCFETCSEPENECSGCKQGCFCRDGYVRDDFLNYKCIPKDECPKS